MLLASLPYVATAVLYWINCGDLFRGDDVAPPPNWVARLTLPILIGCLTSLVAVHEKGSHESWALSVVAVNLAFVIAMLAILRRRETFLDLQLPVGVRDSRLDGIYWWMGLRTIGLVVLAYGCVVNVAVV
jgi:hypothetical protein